MKKNEEKINYIFENFNKESDAEKCFKDMEFLDKMNMETNSLLKEFSPENYLHFSLKTFEIIQNFIQEPEVFKQKNIEENKFAEFLDFPNFSSNVKAVDKKKNLSVKSIESQQKYNFGQFKFQNDNFIIKHEEFGKIFSKLDNKLENIENKLQNLQEIFEKNNNKIFEKKEKETKIIIEIVQENSSKMFEKMENIEKLLNSLQTINGKK